ncbi:RnfABCDGE type electron transport complex subunit D [Deltaproteobacteria bacterium TL4]
MKIPDPLGCRETRFRIHTQNTPIIDLKIPSTLNFTLSNLKGTTYSSLVKSGDDIKSGQPLWAIDSKPQFPSPVNGKVTQIVNVPDIRGNKFLPAVSVKPSSDTSSKIFSPLNPLKDSASVLKERIEQAGIQIDSNGIVPLVELLFPKAELSIDAIIISAVDREPGVTSTIQQFRERSKDAITATNLIAKTTGVKKMFIAVPDTLENDLSAVSQPNQIEILTIPAKYPESFDAALIKRTGVQGPVVVINVEAALAVLDAVQLGKIQDTKVISVIGVNNTLVGNYRVSLGARFEDIFSELGIKLTHCDKVVAGGPMRGYAQYALAGSVDTGINALMMIPADSITEWTGEPCIYCGNCVDVCPVNLQPQLLGNYSEFCLFEKTREFEIEQCLECGLCASVCPSKRSLVQMIVLAKKEIQKAEEAQSGDNNEQQSKHPLIPKLATNDPALVLFSTAPKLTVGYAPHWRSKISLAKINFAFIFALIPAIFTGAVVQFYSARTAELNATLGPINRVLKSFVLEMGLNANFLWFSGIFGTVALGIGAGILSEYLCQVSMRQPYHVTNGHGALMGLILTLMMPPSVPAWVLVVGIFLSIFIGKQLFGGIGSYPMHPVMVGWLLVLLSWPQYVYPIGMTSIASAHSSVIVATAVGGVVLCLLGTIRYEIPVAVILSVVLFSLVFQSKIGGVADQLLAGHVVLAAFFIATDSTCSPANKIARWVYGFGVGFLIMLIRAYGIWPDSVPFAILLMNILNPLIDRLRPKVIKG